MQPRVCILHEFISLSSNLANCFKVDLVKTVASAPHVIADILPAFIPYSVVVAGFAAFVVWNGGIVLGKEGSVSIVLCGTD